jgi:hypothetical protein
VAAAGNRISCRRPPLIEGRKGREGEERGEERKIMPSTGHESLPEGGEEHGTPPEPRSKEAWDFWERIGGPTKVAAPMVRCSELAWRLLVRTHGAQLCYTPMISARAFLAMSIKEREDFIEPHAHDRPLFLQFCTNSPEEFAEVAVAAQGYGDVSCRLMCRRNDPCLFGRIEFL